MVADEAETAQHVVALLLVAAGQRQDRVAERGQRRLVGWAAVERRLQLAEPLRMVGEDHVFF